MVQSRPERHSPTGLMYSWDRSAKLAQGEVQRIELTEHPGHIDRTRREGQGLYDSWVSFCDECCQSMTFRNFTPAMEFLRDHTSRHQAQGRLESQRLESQRLGFKLVGDGLSPRRRAVCTADGCGFSTDWVPANRAERIGEQHFQYHLDNPTPARKENTVTDLAALENRIAATQTTLATLLEHKARLEARPAEPTAKLITFEIRFPGNQTSYSYAAKRARGLWWVTGREGGRGRTWPEMLDFMAQDARVQNTGKLRFRTFATAAGELVKGTY